MTSAPSTAVRTAPTSGTDPAAGSEEIVPYTRWRARAEELHQQFVAAEPFPFVVLDDFLTPEAATRVVETFPSGESDGWINYLRINERTFGMRDRRTMPVASAEVLDELNSDEFVALLGAITGIPALLPDPFLEGAGLHLSDRGGFLNVHADFNVHPHQPRWRRRLNLLIYLNPRWEEILGRRPRAVGRRRAALRPTDRAGLQSRGALPHRREFLSRLPGPDPLSG